MNNTLVWIVAVIILALGGGWWLVSQEGDSLEKSYSPVIAPSEFSSNVTNPYFTLTPGTRFTYEAKKAEGIERIEVTVLSNTRQVMGVEARVVRDTVYLDGRLIEDTLDWYAEDQEGNVWYFGEDTAEYEDGVITSRHGAWEAGVNGAVPGIVMKAQPKVGETYRQEYYAGEAEDMADILSVSESITVPFGSFTNCLKTFDYTPLDPKSLEHKYYCKETEGITLEVDTTDGERTELTKVEKGVVEPKAELTPSASAPVPSSSAPVEEKPAVGGDASGGGNPVVGAKISEATAKATALARVPGIVTDISIEAPFDKPLYVVEIKPSGGGAEVDVSIDMQTGVILSVD